MSFNPEEKPTYGYGKFSNVITGMELERGIRQNGSAVRPSDGRAPQKVAFIQCVGSMDKRLGNLRKSMVFTCLLSICHEDVRTQKKHKNPDTDITVNMGPEFSSIVVDMEEKNKGIRFESFKRIV